MRFSDEEIRRYARQIVIPEVGGVGQERLRAARASARSELEALYLAGAGIGHLTVPTEAIAGAARALNPLVTVELGGEEAADSVEIASERALAALKEALAL